MTDRPHTPTAVSRAWLALLSIVLPLLALASLGMDNNWDLYNYHLYNPHAWWQGRMTGDIAPAQLQSFHSPLLDLPLYLAVRAGWHGALVSLWLCLPFMLALYCLLRLYQSCAQGCGRIDTLVLATLATGGAGASLALGASTNDAFVAAGLLAALCLLLADDGNADRPRRWAMAGLLAGAVAGLKLTAAGYCLGLAVMALLMAPYRQAPIRLAALFLGGLAGFLLTYGYWGWLLYQQHGNPVFPYFNQWFQSPDASPVSYADLRFRPQTFIDIVMVPIRLLDDSRRYSEWILRDPRLLLGMLTLAVLALRTRSVSEIHQRRTRALTVFLFASFLIWALQSGIYRYLLPLEMLACLGLSLFLMQLPREQRPWMAGLVLVLAVAATGAPEVGRLSFSQAFARVQAPVLPRGSMVVISSASPMAVVATRLPDSVPVVAVFNNLMQPAQCTRLQQQAGQRLLTHSGPLWLLRSTSQGDDEGERLLAHAYGLGASGNCYPVATGMGELRLCQLYRKQAATACATR